MVMPVSLSLATYSTASKTPAYLFVLRLPVHAGQHAHLLSSGYMKNIDFVIDVIIVTCLGLKKVL